MSQLVIPLAGVSLQTQFRFRVDPTRVGRCDQPDLAVQDPDQLGEFLGPGGVSGRIQQVFVRPHVTFEVGAGFGE